MGTWWYLFLPEIISPGFPLNVRSTIPVYRFCSLSSTSSTFIYDCPNERSKQTINEIQGVPTIDGLNINNSRIFHSCDSVRISFILQLVAVKKFFLHFHLSLSHGHFPDGEWEMSCSPCMIQEEIPYTILLIKAWYLLRGFTRIYLKEK